MKAIQAIKVVGGALIVLASLNAYSQASDTGADMSTQPSAKQQHKAMKKADRVLARKVRGALAKAKGVSAANIIVRANASTGDVWLEGSVPEQPQVEQSTQVAQGVAGVKNVKNDLTIRPVGQ
ncbi:BON domain-containing protein [Paraburkholderia sp. SOS3]|jgi:hyperosmotically inducible protein|uniref:BON domain-containing protein n=1 Tax=Paraburkholderia sp. SOS3 TaxID=1926494 RepID=UPI00094782C5|nr:BON domain-containing protein [Paraburkholderia sp. SOS3]APR39490.1 BON domain-containing protein [Paraburkholderia sp. SOS3]